MRAMRNDLAGADELHEELDSYAERGWRKRWPEETIVLLGVFAGLGWVAAFALGFWAGCL